MADAKICDRCGEVYSPTVEGIGFRGHFVKNKIILRKLVLSSHGNGYKPEDLKYDLCETCIKELDEWMKGQKCLKSRTSKL